MPFPYRIHEPGGVVIVATNAVIYPGDPEWLVYEQWLVDNPSPMPTPGFAAVEPYVAPVATVNAQRVEMRARLRAVMEKRALTQSVPVSGARYSVTRPALLVYLVQRARTPPFGTLRLPDVDGIFHGITSNELDALIDGAANYHRALLTWAEAKRATIDASPAPMGVTLADYPLPP